MDVTLIKRDIPTSLLLEVPQVSHPTPGPSGWEAQHYSLDGILPEAPANKIHVGVQIQQEQNLSI
jgi:hypothetical protein